MPNLATPWVNGLNYSILAQYIVDKVLHFLCIDKHFEEHDTQFIPFYGPLNQTNHRIYRQA